VAKKRTEQVTFECRLQPLQGLKLEEKAPIDGTIISVMFNFPDGCYDAATGNYLVGMVFGHGKKQLCPNADMLRLNDATPVYPVEQDVNKDDTLWGVLENNDGANIHGVSITATIVGSE
jgi:hypothetical protein